MYRGYPFDPEYYEEPEPAGQCPECGQTMYDDGSGPKCSLKQYDNELHQAATRERALREQNADLRRMLGNLLGIVKLCNQTHDFDVTQYAAACEAEDALAAARELPDGGGE